MSLCCNSRCQKIDVDLLRCDPCSEDRQIVGMHAGTHGQEVGHRRDIADRWGGVNIGLGEVRIDGEELPRPHTPRRMIAVAAVFVAAYNWLEPVPLALGDHGKVTLPHLIGVSPWPVIAALAVVVTVILAFLERYERCKPGTPPGRGEANRDATGIRLPGVRPARAG